MLARQNHSSDAGGLARPRSSPDTDHNPHLPVLLTETVALLDPKPGDHCIDATVGGGSHAAALLERTAPDGRLLAIDLDRHALDIAAETLKPFSPRVTFVHDPFDTLSSILTDKQFPMPDCILADLGLSSIELADETRGFSFQHHASPLDMRFDPSRGGMTAADLLNTAREAELAQIISTYGEERQARTIARSIVDARTRARLITTDDLVNAIIRVYRGKRTKLHPATKTFQALRIAVNDEFGRLERFLPRALGALETGGRLAVISFHSLEDRTVKRFFRERAAAGIVTILTKHPVTPSFAEITNNPRSRSAKLRVAMRGPHP